MWGNTYVGLILLTPLALAVEGTDWSWVGEMTAADWGVLVFAGFFIDAVNTIWWVREWQGVNTCLTSPYLGGGSCNARVPMRQQSQWLLHRGLHPTWESLASHARVFGRASHPPTRTTPAPLSRSGNGP